MNVVSQAVSDGYARTRALTREHAKSFYFSSIALFGQRRASAYALYAFCRRLDDLVDGDNLGDGSVQAPVESGAALAARLQLARDAVSSLYRTGSGGEALPLHPSEFLAFRDTVERYHIPEEPFQELINGMEMDLSVTRYQTFEHLERYCYRVAGVVGLMMTPVLGYSDSGCLPYAAMLGTAMQLTNILRDVREDYARGRIYLPADELNHFGVTEAHLAEGRVDERWVAFMRFQIARARALYQRSALGIASLEGFGSQRLVRLMGALYGRILDVIEAAGYDVFSSRAHVPFTGKLRVLGRVLLTPMPSVQDVDVPRLAEFNR